MSSAESRLNEIYAPIEQGMERMREVLIQNVSDGSAAVRDMTDHVKRFRGKQMRAALVLLSGEATGNATEEHASIAAIVEMIHLATLVHDDILDGAEVRRRVACVNQRWDNQMAVLLGDFLYARAFALSTDLSSRLCSQVLSETTRRICVGEIEQSTQRYDFDLTQERYEQICGAKTASLYAAACELGARYPGGRVEVGDEMRRFGWEIGLAFQIIDDCLDVFGEAQVVGKSVGTDVEDGKVTLPILHVYRNAPEAIRAKIRDVYTVPGLENRVQSLRDVCDLQPGLDYAMARAHGLVDSAVARLETLPEGPARKALQGISEFVLERKF